MSIVTDLKAKIDAFFEKESAIGIFLCITAIIALIVANSPMAGYYAALIDTHVAVYIGEFKINKPLLLWVNDGLMAFFFFLIGLELKREFLEGELRQIKKITLPAIGAAGGMLVPALIYVAFNYQNPAELHGWAIPAATDIAFALGILALLGKRVPATLKLLLASIAVFDDMGAIIIIALFYTSKLSLVALGIAAACIVLLYIINRLNVVHTGIYFIIGIVMWAATLKSGVHATLAGIILAFFIPIKDNNNAEHSPLKKLEHDLHFFVNLVVLPIFAFCNAGVAFHGLGAEQFVHHVPLGVALGLFLGKQIGVFSFCWASIKMGIAEMPRGANWTYLYGLSALCGIGFTMSLFIGGLAFETMPADVKDFDERIGILVGSFFSGIVGYFVLSRASKKGGAAGKSRTNGLDAEQKHEGYL